MQAYGINAVNDRFDMLRQLGNVFIVQPDVLRSYMTESHLGRIDAQLLKPYLKERSDWSQFSRSLAFEDTEEVPSGTATPSTLLPLRASRRISAMSGVAGAGYQRLRDALRDFESLTERTGTAGGADTPGSGAATPAARPLPPSAFALRASASPAGSSAPTSNTGSPAPPPRRGPLAGPLAYMGGHH